MTPGIAVCSWRRLLASRHLPLNPLPPQAAVPIGLSPPRALPPPAWPILNPPYSPFPSLGRLCQRSPQTFPVSLLCVGSARRTRGGGWGACVCSLQHPAPEACVRRAGGTFQGLPAACPAEAPSSAEESACSSPLPTPGAPRGITEGGGRAQRMGRGRRPEGRRPHTVADPQALVAVPELIVPTPLRPLGPRDREGVQPLHRHCDVGRERPCVLGDLRCGAGLVLGTTQPSRPGHC